MKRLSVTFTLAFTLALTYSTTAWTSNIAIVDSGTDFNHELLNKKNWTNISEKTNGIDDDNNKKIDDLIGWNFNNNNNSIFNKSLLKTTINNDVFTLMKIIAHIDLNIVNENDKKFIDAFKTRPKGEQNFILSLLNWYGEYSHGTHVSGIASMGKNPVKLMATKVFADDIMPEKTNAKLNFGINKSTNFSRTKFGNYRFTKLRSDSEAEDARLVFYSNYGKQMNDFYEGVSKYIFEKKMDIANFSLGLQFSYLIMDVLKQLGNFNPTQDDIDEEATLAFSFFEKAGKDWIESSKNTLFVIAAGNSSSNNDNSPVYPANLNTDNSITVAATVGYKSFATFSNFGKQTVQIAAPGVAIPSAVPYFNNKLIMPMSGTSMASPYIVMVASLLKDINTALSPKDVKTILIETVDVKSWLKDKVTSSGIVNHTRAMAAAKNSKTMRLSDAITKAKKDTLDLPDNTGIWETPNRNQRLFPADNYMKMLAKKFKF